MRVWHWVTDATFEPITWKRVTGTGKWIYPQSEHQAVMGYPSYDVLGPDGTRYLRVTVPLNGDA